METTVAGKTKKIGDNGRRPDSGEHNEAAIQETAIEETLNRYLEISQCATAWGGNVAKIGALELRRSVSASKQALALRLIQLPVLLVLYISLCVAAYLAVATLTSNVYWGLAATLGLQIVLLIYLQLRAVHFGRLIGFDATRRQIKEAWNDITSKTE